MHDRLSLAANRRRLAAALADHLRSAGAADISGVWCQFVLETAAGPLELTISVGVTSVTVFGWFSDPALSVTYFTSPGRTGCFNPYSGKWNHHYWSSHAAADALQNFRGELAPLLLPLPGAKKIRPAWRRKTRPELFDCHPE